MEAVSFNIKTQRTFTFIRKYAWLVTLTIGIGGLFFPYLGLLVLPIILALSTICSIFSFSTDHEFVSD